jgi:hypothetical protein
MSKKLVKDEDQEIDWRKIQKDREAAGDIEDPDGEDDDVDDISTQEIIKQIGFDPDEAEDETK